MRIEMELKKPRRVTTTDNKNRQFINGKTFTTTLEAKRQQTATFFGKRTIGIKALPSGEEKKAGREPDIKSCKVVSRIAF